MISNLSSFLVDKFFSNEDTNEEERELYIYGLFMFLSHFIYLVLVFIFGCILKCVVESLIFYISFYQIRRYAGGYHAKTELRCEISSALIMMGSISIIKLSQMFSIYIPFYISVIAFFIIFFLSPLDTAEKPLSQKEFIFFRKKSRISLILIFLIAIILYIFKHSIIFLPCSMSLIVESILLVAGKVKQIRLGSSRSRE